MRILVSAGVLSLSAVCMSQQEVRGQYSFKIPNPTMDASSCHMPTTSFLCDSNNVLTPDQKKRIAEESVGYFSLPSHHICGPSRNDEIQIAVAVIKKMDGFFNKYSISEDDVADDDVLLATAKELAIQTHNDWGVGAVHDSCNGTGILLFLSLEDKTCFISVGKAISQVLTDRRLDYIITKVMKTELRDKHYDKAILSAVRQIRNYIAQGPPTMYEHLNGILLELTPFLLFVLLALLFIRIAEYRQRLSRSDYAAVSSQLNEIERSRALALQGEYNCTSCPICLEPFQLRDNISHSSCKAEEKTINDSQQERLLLLCDVSIGSDGLPVKLLRCGHVFDETCWQEWVTNGRGAATTCPICRANIGVIPSPTTDVAENPNSLVDQHPNEMRFRLSRLMARYPSYISQSNIVLWTEDGYDGPIRQDPNFAGRDTVNHRYFRQEGFPTTSFGGGKSTGGRGGKW